MTQEQPEITYEPLATVVAIEPVRYTARQTIRLSGAAGKQEAYRVAMETAREAGIPAEATVSEWHSFSLDGPSDFSFSWPVKLLPVELLPSEVRS